MVDENVVGGGVVEEDVVGGGVVKEDVVGGGVVEDDVVGGIMQVCPWLSGTFPVSHDVHSCPSYPAYPSLYVH